MLLALLANIEYLEKEGSSQFRVRNGEFISEVGGVFLYEFTLDFLQEIVPDSEVELRIRYQTVGGKVIATNGRTLQITVDKNLGATIAEATVIVSSSYLLQLLHDRLKETREGAVILSDLADKTFGLVEPIVGTDMTYEFPSLTLGDRKPPNEYQEQAIRQALGSEVLFIWGPPGTGKTTTIAQIIEGFIERDMSVLLLAHTNVATDGAFGDFIELQVAEESLDYQNGKFIRVGDITPKSKLAQLEMVRLDIIEQKVGAELRKEIDELRKKVEVIEKRIKSNQKLLSQFLSLDKVNAEATKLGKQLDAKKEEVEKQTEDLKKANRNLEEADEAVTRYQTKGTIGRFFTADNLDVLMARKVDILTRIGTLEHQIATGQKILAKGERIGNDLLDQRDELLSELRDHDREVIQREYDVAQSETKPLEEQIGALQKQLESLRVKLIGEAKVISTTLTKSYSDKSVLAREYDCIIIDEASMAPLPALWYACGLAKEKVVIVGDFYQLPPVVKHRVLKEKKSKIEVEQEEALIKKWLMRDIFGVVGIPEAIKKGVKPPVLQQLKIQYRMHPDIGDVINALVYAKGSGHFSLEHGESTFDNGVKLLDKEPLRGAHIGFYDTSEKHAYPSKTDSGSYYNLLHALFCVELAQRALDNGYKSVGIVTPFRPQANLIQKILIDRQIDKDETVDVDTVHRFQGGQKDVIIFDIVTSQKTKLTDDDMDGGDDEKLINVAFSRAVEKCMVVGDVPLLLKKHSNTSLFRKYFDYCTKKGHVAHSCEGILTEFEAKMEAEKWLEKIYNAESLEVEMEKSAIYDQTDFYPRFIKDLLSATKEVVICSPYITEERMKTFYPIFHHLLGKKVNVFVLTRKTEEHTENMKLFADTALKKMNEMGITILPFKGFEHRKLAVVDRELVWEGSLNILSQRESGEFMRRIEGAETSKQMMQFLRLDRNIGMAGENNLEKCEQCKEPGAYYWNGTSRFGPWTYCLARIHGKGKSPKTAEERKAKKKSLAKARRQAKEYTDDGEPICPEHEIPMVKKKGHWGEFWGCQRYPRCRITEKIR